MIELSEDGMQVKECTIAVPQFFAEEKRMKQQMGPTSIGRMILAS